MKIAIIGGGAAGFFGALSASYHFPGARITIFEATQKPLEKVRISGGGRCNVTHNCFDPAVLCGNYPRGSKELRGPFNRFGPADTVDWFESRGVKLKSEPDGRMFPTTDNSATIIAALHDAAQESNIDIQLGSRVKEIRYASNGSNSKSFTLAFNDDTNFACNTILLATGSSPPGYRFAKNLGHEIIPCVPSLFTFKINDKRLDQLAGVSFEKVELEMIVGEKAKFKQVGPALITHWGLSGPAVLKLSAWGARSLREQNYQADLRINILPGEDSSSIRKIIDKRRDLQPKKRISGDNPFPVANRYWKRLLELDGVSNETTWANITAKTISHLISELTAARFSINGKGIFKEEFVTCGGVKLSEVDFKTMQSKLCPGLYFAGEILDIDGITGGFNFQSAWTTSFIAGSFMGSKVIAGRPR